MKLPEEFVARIRTQFADSERFFAALEEKSPTSVRLNPHKKSAFDISDLKPVPWCGGGFYLPKRPSFTFDPLFHAGAYYVQEAGSMFLSAVWDEIEKHGAIESVLDLCAAPGGKSTLLLDKMGEKGMLVANEIIDKRNKILRENLTKWGNPNFVVVQNEPKTIGKMTSFFEVIAVDAPCSGEGLFRKDPDATKEWSPQNLEKCALRQNQILEDIWNALKPNGFLIYSTCTYNPKENEELLAQFAEKHRFESIEIPIEESWNIQKIEKNGIVGYQMIPGFVESEGFFCSVLQKREGEEVQYKSFPTSSENKFVSKYFRAEFTPKISEIKFQEHILAVGKPVQKHLKYLKNHLYIKQLGVEIGTEIRGELIPNHGLALAVGFEADSFAAIDLDLDSALKYFSKEPFDLPNTEKGFCAVTYQNIPLGFLKNLGNRHNNLYPLDWRIRKRT